MMATSTSAEHTIGRVLVVDDEPVVGRVMARALSRHGHEAVYVSSAMAAIERLAAGAFDAVVTDVSMPDMDGVELLMRINRVEPDLPIVLVTGAPSVDTAIAAVQHHAFAYLRKPFSPGALGETVARAVLEARVRRGAEPSSGVGRQGVAECVQLDLALDAALASLHIHYQPIVSWSAQREVGYEALVRSHSKVLPHPGALFDAAERLGRRAELSRSIWTLTPVPFVAEDTRLFVNLHPHDLMDEWLYSPEQPLAKLAGRVVLELTERASLDGISDLTGRIRRLRELGYRIAVDDIGAGYSGLAALVALEPDTVKIDMGLVRGIDSSDLRRRVVWALLTLCRELSAEVVAEGVETAAERDALLDLGCDLFQGYLFARPAPPFVTPTF